MHLVSEGQMSFRQFGSLLASSRIVTKTFGTPAFQLFWDKDSFVKSSSFSKAISLCMPIRKVSHCIRTSVIRVPCIMKSLLYDVLRDVRRSFRDAVTIVLFVSNTKCFRSLFLMTTYEK